jgi:hypothetical protein
MAVKKTVTPKKGSTSKPATKKAAPKKSAPKKSPKSAGGKPKPATKKTAAKKAPALKLTDAQGRLLAAVSDTKEAGYLGNKAQAKSLDALLKRKMIKRGKKEGGFYRYMVTKAGAKHVPVAAPPAPSAPAPVAEAPLPPPVVAPV